MRGDPIQTGAAPAFPPEIVRGRSLFPGRHLTFSKPPRTRSESGSGVPREGLHQQLSISAAAGPDRRTAAATILTEEIEPGQANLRQTNLRQAEAFVATTAVMMAAAVMVTAAARGDGAAAARSRNGSAAAWGRRGSGTRRGRRGSGARGSRSRSHTRRGGSRGAASRSRGGAARGRSRSTAGGRGGTAGIVTEQSGVSRSGADTTDHEGGTQSHPLHSGLLLETQFMTNVRNS